MKKTKKLLAILAAMAMAMSPISVLAETNTLPAEDSNTNHGNIEGAIKEELISVELPTIGDNAFDFVLDPQLLMERTGSADSNKNGTPVVTEAGASVYFMNADAGKYAVSSSALSVTNKSSVGINVSVKAELTLSSGDAITVVDSTGDAADVVSTGSALNLRIGLRNVSTDAVSYIAGESDATCEAVATAEMDGLSADNFKPAWNAGKNEYEYVVSGSAAGTTTAFVFEGECNTQKAADWTKVKDMEANLTVVWNITAGGNTISNGDTIKWTDTSQDLTFTIDAASFNKSSLLDVAIYTTQTFGYAGVNWGDGLKTAGMAVVDGDTVTIKAAAASYVRQQKKLYFQFNGATTRTPDAIIEVEMQ